MLSQVHRHIKSILSPPRYYLGGLSRRLVSNPVPIWCQAIAFKVLVTVAPLILLATGIFGLVLKQDDPFERVAVYFREFLPAAQSAPMIELMQDLQRTSGALTVLGSVAFLFTVVTLFGTLRFVISSAMGTGRHEPRSRLQGFGFDFRMAVQVGLLFLLSFGVTFAVNTLQVESMDWGRDSGVDVEALQRGWRFVLPAVALIVPWLISLAMFAQLFYFIPRPKPPLRSALLGATVTAVLFEGAKNGFTLYAGYSGRFFLAGGSQGPDTLGSLQGVFLLILIFVAWAYISGLILVIGAIIASLHEQRHRPRRSAAQRLWRMLRQRRSADPGEMMEEDGTQDPKEISPQAGGPVSVEPRAAPA